MERLEEIIKYYGTESQLDVSIEELSELIQSICKFRRYGTEKQLLDMTEEMADVEIMLDQLKIIFKLKQDDIDTMKEYKVTRQLRRIEESILKGE